MRKSYIKVIVFNSSSQNRFSKSLICVFPEYPYKFMDPSRRTTFIEALFIYSQPIHLGPFLVLFICLYFDLDGPYWFLEDVGPDPMYRNISTLLTFLVLRAILLMPGFAETVRGIYVAGFGVLFLVVYIKETLDVLTKKVRSSHKWFKYYTRFYIISNVLAEAVSQTVFLAVTVVYILIIQVFWMIVRGWGKLSFPIYFMFCLFAVFIIFAVCLFLPLVGITGEIVTDILWKRRAALKRKLNNDRHLENKIFVKQVAALLPIKFCYGGYYKLGKSFSRNVFENVIENLLSMILIYDFNGRIEHKR